MTEDAVAPLVVTIDIDWAPDPAIDLTAEMLRAAAVPATWFLTHDSPAVRRLGEWDQFELGIHPNFLPGSSHGATTEEVLDTCMALVPGAVSMRTHALVQSTPILDVVLERTPIRCDASLLLPWLTDIAFVEMEWKGRTLLRVPYFWEDDVEMVRHSPSWDVAGVLAYAGRTRGPAIMDFHPIHIALNSSDMDGYRALQRSGRPLPECDADVISQYRSSSPGAGDLFAALLEAVRDQGLPATTMAALYAEWRTGRPDGTTS